MKTITLILLLIFMINSPSLARDISNEQKIAGLYVAFFNRAPDMDGINYWKGRTNTILAQGKSPMVVFKEISQGFSTHPVFSNTYDSLSDEEFVKAIYINTLGREGDASGIDYWNRELENGLSRSDMVAIFIDASLTVDLTSQNFPTLSAEELSVAKLRQDLITYKTQVALEFINQLQDKTNIQNLSDLENDSAYKASIKVLSGITEDPATLDEAKAYIDTVAENPNAIDNILKNFSPLSDISSCIVNITYSDGTVGSACIEAYPKENCPSETYVESDKNTTTFMQKGDCASLYFPLNPKYTTTDDSTNITYDYYVKTGAYISIDSAPTYINWENNSSTVSATVTLPQNSPISVTNADIQILFSSFSPNSDGKVNIKFPKDKITDAYIMIQDQASGKYMVYLYSMLLPGETDVTFSATQTAVNMVLSGIDHKYILGSGTPKEVKDAVEQNSANFIAYFKQNLESNPYFQKVENLTDIYKSSYYTEALANSKEILKEMYNNNQALKPQSLQTSDTINVSPQDEISDFKIVADRKSAYYFFSEDLTGDIAIQNDTMLPARYKATNIFTKMPIHMPNTGLFGDLISPQSTLLYGYISSKTTVNTRFQPSSITIYTPGWAYLSSDTPNYNYIQSMNRTLNERMVLDSVITTLISLVPAGDEQVYMNLAKWIASEAFYKVAIDEYYANKGKGSLLNVVTTIVKNLATLDNLKTIIQKVSIHYSKNPVKLALQQAKWAEKLTKAGVGISIYAADLSSLEFDLMKTPAYIRFDKVTFPVFLKYYDPAYPAKLAKVTTTDETRKVTLTGDGLYGEGANPTIELAALDKDGKYQPYTLSADKIHKGNGSIWFDIPFSWLDVGSDIVGPVYFQLSTSFTDSSTNNQIDVKVPASFRDEHYKVFLDMELSISSLSKNKLVRGESLTIYGKGFSMTNSDIKIYFTDHNSKTIEVDAPTYHGANSLETKVPEDLAFGYVIVQVKMNNQYKSNIKNFDLIPKIVTASPSNIATSYDFKDPFYVTLSQSEGVDIKYTLNTSDTILSYTGPIHIDKTTTIYPFARAVVGGLNYDSGVPSGGYLYYKCADNEELKDGECVKQDNNQPTDKAWDNWPNPQWCPMKSADGIDVYINKADSNGDGHNDTYISCDYYESGQLEQEIPYMNDELNGIMKDYDPSGQLVKESPYTYSEENGVEKWYYGSGQINYEIPYVNNGKNGTEKEYYESGCLKTEYIYNNDYFISEKDYNDDCSQ